MKLSDLIGFDKKTDRFVIGTHDLNGNTVQGSTFGQRDVDSMLAEMYQWSRDDHIALAQTILPPIEKVVPYVEQYPIFFMPQAYGELDDNSIAVEDTVAIAWETHQDGAARPVRSGYSFTRPGFLTYDTAIEVPWAMTRKAGWNFLERQMRRAAEELAKKRDQKARDIFVAALLPSHVVTVSGGLLTKAGLNTVVKNAADIGFPVQRALVNPGTLKDFADFTWPVGVNLPDSRVEQLLRTLYIADYAGIAWYTNPFTPTDRVKFSGDPSQVGWHQTRGGVRNSSDVDMLNKRDLYLIEDQEHAWFVGNDATLWEIRITA